ncbi:MAG: DUF6529 family protein [Ilumatobacter sp.]|uniref:DUF6529 family protein n=1 Tax=Ilumatobacter sp. TaxID=1967498 RepID=UPI003C7938A6
MTSTDHAPTAPVGSSALDDPTPTGTVRLVASALVGAAVSVALGVYGRAHSPTGERILNVGAVDTLTMKAWLATGLIVLVATQLGSAFWMFGRLSRLGPAPTWIGPLHRWSGTAAFLLTLPVAYHCLWSLGFQDRTTRVLVHSLAGCAFYGALATKLLVLRSDRMPRWAVPVAGAGLVTTLAVIWLTSALWFFTGLELPPG